MDPYFKKTVTLRQGPTRLELAVSQELFSSHDVDRGTRLLLRSLSAADIAAGARILDVGCGYGPLGLGLGAVDSRRTVHMVDRDALAVAYAHSNAVANGVTGAEVYGSLGYDDVAAERFDVIVANVPGKGTRALYEHLLLDAGSRLAEGGLVAIVVVAPLEALLAEILASAGPTVEVAHHERGAGYAVFHYRMPRPPADGPVPGGFDRRVYQRDSTTFEDAGVSYRLDTAHGLPEFDTLSFHTGLALDAIRALVPAELRRVTVWNPGQGHVPAYLARRAPQLQLRLLDRDLLALRVSRANATANGLEAGHVELGHTVLEVPQGAPDDLVVDLLRAKEPPAAVRERAARVVAGLAPDARLVVAGRSTSVTRYVSVLEQASTATVVRRHRSQGCMVTELRKKPTPPG
jgi:16S rRNA G1207 methylase RsmC